MSEQMVTQSVKAEPVEISKNVIEWMLEDAGITAVLYEVPETACLQMADLTEAQRAVFDHLAVWASVELDSKDEDRFWDALAQEARPAGRFNDFVQAVRYAVINETEPGRTAITFRGFTWEEQPDDEAPQSEHAPAVFEPGV